MSALKHRKRELRLSEIHKQNVKLLQRLQNKTSTYSFNQFDQQRKSEIRLIKNISHFHILKRTQKAAKKTSQDQIKHMMKLMKKITPLRMKNRSNSSLSIHRLNKHKTSLQSDYLSIKNDHNRMKEFSQYDDFKNAKVNSNL